MATPHYQRVKELYQAVCDLPPDEQRRHLEHLGVRDGDELRSEVEELLRADSRVTSFLESPVIDGNRFFNGAAASLAAGGADESVPVSIGRYRIVRLIGEGGMGRVYEAEQDVPHRRVAIKIVRAGLSSPKLRERFKNEAEILGRLHHKGIAQVYDAGVGLMQRHDGSTANVPFLAMEYVDGAALTDYAARRALNDRQRLQLLTEVCDAVHYGHVQGVIHRDLKPTNILVEASGEVKVIDFGVARATDGDLAVTSLHTNAGQILGTLAYMSPEQVSAAHRTVDARSDVYSLGVIGYELLSNRLPFDLAGMMVAQAARVIQDAEPSRMSSISRVFRGDIETIIGKAIEKEPGRRYQTAAELAADIRRYLAHEPIVARPPTFRYQLGKFARRHKELVAGLALVFLVLIGGIIGTGLALLQAQQRAADATRQANRAMAASEFMKEVLGASNPVITAGGRDVRVADVLDQAAAQLDQQVALDPSIELQARWTIGESYLGLSLHERALANLTRARELAHQTSGPSSRDALRISNTLAWVLLDLDRYADAMTVAKPSVEIAIATFGPADKCSQELLYTAASITIAVSECPSAHSYLDKLHDSITPLTPADRSVDLRTVLLTKARAAQGDGDWQAAQARIREAIAEPNVNPSHVTLRQRRGTSLPQLLENQDMLKEAEEAWRQLLADNERRFGPDHAETHYALAGLRGTLCRVGDFAEALEILKRELDSSKKLLPEGHPKIGMIWGNIGTTQLWIGDKAQAALAYEQAVRIWREHAGDSFNITQTWWREAVIRLGMGLHDPWASESLRRHCLRSVDDALIATPTTSFDFDEVDWSSLRFTLEPYRSDEGESVRDPTNASATSGDLAAIKSMPDPDSGIYQLHLRADRSSGEPLQTSCWILIAPWNVRAFRTWPCIIDNPEYWQRAAAAPNAVERNESSLCYSIWWDLGFGPMKHEHWCGLNAQADIEVPPGTYALAVNLDDGVRIWLDEELVLDDWTHRGWGLPVNQSAIVQITPGPHRMRVEHFQEMGDARLWVRLEPVSP